MAFQAPVTVAPSRITTKATCFPRATRYRPHYLRARRRPIVPSASRRRVTPTAALAAGSGLSDHDDLEIAVPYAVEAAKYMMGDVTPTLAIIGVTSNRPLSEVVALMRKEIGEHVPLVGATSCSFVLTPRGAIADAVSVMLLGGVDGAFATAGAVYGGGVDVGSAAATAAADLKSKLGGDAELVYVMSSPGNEEAVLRGVADVFGADVAVFGGSAADNEVAGDWAVVEANAGVMTNGVAIFGIRKGAGVRVGAHLVSPYSATETAASVTGAEGRTLISLDGERAADVLYKQVGDVIETQYKNGGMTLTPMSTRPYALRRGDDEIAVHVSAINQPEGTVSLFAEAKEGDTFVAMQNFEGGDPVETAGEAIRRSYTGALEAGGIEGRPTAALLIYCGGLGIAVGEGLEWNMVGDLQRIEGLPDAIIGFTAFGEQGPCDGRNQHRNLSVGMLVMQ